MIVNLDSESGSACLKKAKAAGIKTIDYDRLTLGGGAAYYVSFDNVKVGKLMGEGLTKCLTDAKKTAANVVFINGDPTDNNAALFKQGYARRSSRRSTPATTSSSATRPATGTPTMAGTAFEQIYTAERRQDRRRRRRPTTRWPAASSPGSRPTSSTARSRSPARTRASPGLQAILAGDQCMTVYKAIKKEADAASALAIALIKGDDTANARHRHGQGHRAERRTSRRRSRRRQAIYKDNVKDVIDDGYQTAADVCTGGVRGGTCTAAGIS